MQELVMIKLGGSLITDKRGEAAVRTETLDRLAKEIAMVLPELGERLVIGHGSGSFGHATAARHGVGGGPLAADRAFGVSDTRAAAARLHAFVCSSLLQAGLAPFTWAPSSALVAHAGRPVGGNLEPLLAALDFGLLPVVYGDVVLDRQWGAAICSTEVVLGYLVRRLTRRGWRIRRVVWLGATDGIYDAEGVTIPRIDRGNVARTRQMIGATDGTDVTGGMLLRLETARRLARRGIESLIVNGQSPGLLSAALRSEDVPGTRYLPDS